MPKELETLEQIAKKEAKYEQERAEAREALAANADKVAKAVPERFFELAKDLREAVNRFNTAGDPSRRLSWRESPALTTHDSNLNADFNLSFGREKVEVTVALNAMGRTGKPDAYLIEGSGRLNNEPFMLRVDGMVKKGEKAVSYRMTLNYRRLEFPVDELAERLVLATVKQEFNVFYK